MATGKGKTSFKHLLQVQATPEAGGGLGKIKEHRDRILDLKRKAPAQGAKRPSEGVAHAARAEAAPPVAAAGREDFIAAAAFTGSRPGFVFHTGPMGTGYYRDASQPAPVSSAGVPAGFFDEGVPAPPGAMALPSGRPAEPAPPAGSLPAGFFDNPREDPANAAKKARVSATQEGERLRLELASFEKSIEPEVQAAGAIDELEDEAEAELRAAEHDREQQLFAQRVRALREAAQAEHSKAAERQARCAAACRAAVATGPGSDDGSSEGEGEDDLLVDWRSKRRG